VIISQEVYDYYITITNAKIKVSLSWPKNTQKIIEKWHVKHQEMHDVKKRWHDEATIKLCWCA